MYLTIKESKRARTRLTNFLIAQFSPRYEHCGYKQRTSMNTLIKKSIDFLEEEGYINKTEKIDPKYRKLMKNEVHSLIASIMYGNIMNPDVLQSKKLSNRFLQGLSSEKEGKYAVFYYPETKMELERLEAKNEERIEKISKKTAERLLQTKNFLNGYLKNKQSVELPEHKQKKRKCPICNKSIDSIYYEEDGNQYHIKCYEEENKIKLMG